MAKDFFERLNDYYTKVGEVLKGNAEASSIFPNSTDRGISREKIYAEFIKTHAPSKCNIFFGGFLFDRNGNESKQLDIIVTNDTTPQFNLDNKDSNGKSFSPIEGTLAVASVKSKLDKKELIDSLNNISSIPPMEDLGDRLSFTVQILDYDNCPLKIIYSNDGLEVETILLHINQFYLDNPDIPMNRRPDIIHVAGKYIITRVRFGLKFKNAQTRKLQNFVEGTYIPSKTNSDIQGLVFVINEIQKNVIKTSKINFEYDWILNKLSGIDD
ncbi:DUF6602 domain-containing protein [Chryseobacterium sp. MMS23-Vi53]|uniref:DUF6602 domain-containing protein n=1 Tax=Chryseobacterium sp. MMS23-Vi53 TaxID=3386644 RepID=UPI0039ED8E22